MYLDRTRVEEIIDTCGLGSFRGIFLSSEEGKTKHTGRLFELFLAGEGLTPARTMHVGDHPQSDVKVPRRLGMKIFPLERAGPGRDGPGTAPPEGLLGSILFSLERSQLR